MARSQHDATFDYNLRLKDAGLVAADAAATVGGTAQVIDLGDARADVRIKAHVTAVEVGDSNELFLIIAQFSDVSDFSTGTETIVNGGALVLGALETTKNTADSGAGDYEIVVTNEVNGTVYRYMRLYTECIGTVGTGINYSANAHIA